MRQLEDQIGHEGEDREKNHICVLNLLHQTRLKGNNISFSVNVQKKSASTIIYVCTVDTIVHGTHNDQTRT